MKKLFLILIVGMFSISTTYAQWPDIDISWTLSGECNCQGSIDSVFLVTIQIVDVANGYYDVYSDLTYESGATYSTSFTSDDIQIYCNEINHEYTPSFMVYVGVYLICQNQSQIVVCKKKASPGPYSCLDFSNGIPTISLLLVP